MAFSINDKRSLCVVAMVNRHPLSAYDDWKNCMCCAVSLWLSFACIEFIVLSISARRRRMFTINRMFACCSHVRNNFDWGATFDGQAIAKYNTIHELVQWCARGPESKKSKEWGGPFGLSSVWCFYCTWHWNRSEVFEVHSKEMNNWIAIANDCGRHDCQFPNMHIILRVNTHTHIQIIRRFNVIR